MTTPVESEPRTAIQFSMRFLLFLTIVGALFAYCMSVYGVEPVLPYVFLVVMGVLLVVLGNWLVQGVQSAAANDPTSPMKLETFNDNFQASALVARLEEHGVHATAVGGYVSGFQAESPGYVDVVVPQVEFENAKSLIEQWERETTD